MARKLRYDSSSEQMVDDDRDADTRYTVDANGNIKLTRGNLGERYYPNEAGLDNNDDRAQQDAQLAYQSDFIKRNGLKGVTPSAGGFMNLRGNKGLIAAMNFEKILDSDITSFGMKITPAQKSQLLQKIASGDGNWQDALKTLTPDQQAAHSRGREAYQTYNSGNKMKAVKAIGPLVAGALGSAYLGGAGATGAEFAGPVGEGVSAGALGASPTIADAAWGVNAANTGSGEFGLSGATAGNLAGTGGLSSAAGIHGLGAGVGAAGAGLGSGAAGAAALGGTSLLTPSLLAAGGLGAAAVGGLGSSGGGMLGGATTGATGGATAPAAMGGAAAGGAATAGGSALSRLLDGTATTADYTSLLGGLGSAGLGFLGAGQQADAYENVADKYLALGAPSRARLEASYAPGFSMADQPDFQNALDVGAQAAARATSARVGNPVDNPGAYADMQKYITGSLALPQLNTYRSQLGTFGQLGTNTAGAADTGAASQTTGQFNALGYGLDQITKPDNQNNQLMKLLLNSGRSF